MDTLKKEIWFRDDIENGLSAVWATMEAVAHEGAQSPEKQAYRHGFSAALTCVATALGVSLPALRAGGRQNGVDHD